MNISISDKMEKKKITCAYCKRRASVHLMCFGGGWNHSYYLCWEHFKGIWPAHMQHPYGIDVVRKTKGNISKLNNIVYGTH